MSRGEAFAARMMRFTGKLRHIFGPAATGSLDEPVKEPTEAQRRDHEQHMAQFTVERLPNGQSYLVAKDPSDGSNLR
ncbi:hypothetical protein [Arthrobacter castelli]|uniref:hypothetical protein n=1 Tax=Arthrobacter castelli TaxID=271431 RepID=UPI000422DD27|nr:hypothetical protein [Arthrobacter castelli]